jgi:hypothetical protein
MKHISFAIPHAVYLILPIATTLCLIGLAEAQESGDGKFVRSEKATFRMETLAEGLDRP